MSDTTPPGPPEMLGASDQLFPSLIFASEVRITELEDAPLQGFMVATPYSLRRSLPGSDIIDFLTKYTTA